MKTPKDLQRLEKEKTKSNQEECLKTLETTVSNAVDWAAQAGALHSSGGTVEVPSFDSEKYLTTVLDYFKRNGWEAQYKPREEGYYSMTTESEGSYTRHFFQLKPLQE